MKRIIISLLYLSYTVKEDEDKPKLRLITWIPASIVSIIARDNSSGVALGKIMSLLFVLFASSSLNIGFKIISQLGQIAGA